MNRPRPPASAARATSGQKPRAAQPRSSARAKAAAPDQAEAASGVRVLKKYPNRRLYDTASSSYITLAEVKALVMRAEPFVVRDAKTGEDLTRSILLQIILEEEAGGSPLLSEAVLCQLIRFYGHAMQGFLGAQLAAQIQAFAEMQQQLVAAAPAAGMEGWPGNWPELLGRYAPTGQAWQQAQAQMQAHVQAHMQEQQAQLQAGWQRWMQAFAPPPGAAPTPTPEPVPDRPQQPPQASAKPARRPSAKR